MRTPAEVGTSPSQSLKKQMLPPEQWPTYWRDLLTRTPSTPALVWTYPALSRDLGGDADDAHRNLLRRLLRDMALPKGSHAFWPLNPYPYTNGVSEQTIDATFFLSGIAHLKPSTVILMTGTAPPELELVDVRPLTPMIVEGRRFVVTPHVDALLENSSRYAQLMTFLKSLLRQM